MDENKVTETTNPNENMPGLLGMLAANPLFDINRNEMDKFWAEKHKEIIFNLISNGFSDLNDDGVLVRMLTVSNTILADMKEQAKAKCSCKEKEE